MNDIPNPDTSVASLSPLKQAFLALQQAEARIRELEDAASEPIAIVGMSCRIPGDEAGTDGYWRLLLEQRSSVSERVEERFSGLLQEMALPRSAHKAALLEQVDLFDPRHFGISPREAAGIDPQQRLLLEVSWEALENAAIDPFSLYQSSTGVYIGISSLDYAQLRLRSGGLDGVDPHFASGAAASVAAGRLSYVLGLNGPAVSIDTACSSSLVAVHMACEALRRNECTAALAGGVNLILSPESSIAFAQAGMLSSSGEVRAFDAGADGFVRGEGCGVLLLKRLSSARECGDRILGLILGSAVNQDGASSGLTVPNGLAQQALLRQAHRRSGIESWQVGYVEAHGTGTALGDPIEAEALGAVFGPARRADKLLIGSVKTNIGHLESAAGVAGLIKLVLSLQHGVIPGQLHWNAPSEHVRWNELGLEVVTEARAWEPIGGRRIGGVSSFGFSGTNAHTVVESWEQPPAQPELDSGPEVPVEVLVLSARSEAALRDLLERYAAFLAESEAAWSAICWTAAMGRAVFAERLAVVAPDKAEAAGKLRAWLRGENPAGVYRGQVGAGHRAAAAVLGAEASMEQAAAGFVQGNAVDWEKRSAGRTLRRTALPAYPFQRQRYWIEPSGPASQKLSQEPGGKATGRAMLGWRIRSAGVRGQYETLLREAEWVGGHRVEGRAILPATGHLELMLEASAETLAAPCVLEQVLLQAPLTVQQERRIQTVVETETGGRSRVRVYAEQPGGTWEPVSEGWLKPAGAAPLQPPDTPAIDAQAALDLQTAILNIQAIQDRLRPVDAGDAFYASLAARGLDFGQRFRGVQRAWAGQAEALGEIVAPLPGPGWEIAPWWLDACLQVAALAADAPADAAGPPDTNRPPSAAQSTDLYLPMSLDRLQIYRQPEERSWSHISFRRIDQHTLAANLTVANTQGNTVLHCANLQFRKVGAGKAEPASLLYRIEWRKEELANRLQRSAIHEAAIQIERKIEQWNDSEAISQYNSFFVELESLSAEYVLQAFRQLSWPEPVHLWQEQTLQDFWKIAPQYRRLMHRLLEIAEEAGVVSRVGEGFYFAPIPEINPADHLALLRKHSPFGDTEINLVVRCGESLAQVLTGKINGRELIFPNGASDDVSRLYGDSVPARIYNEMVADLVSRIATAHSDAKIRILEVGGGTAATTGKVLEALHSTNYTPAEYLFTDIAPLLVRRAESSFRHHSFFHARAFDLERDAITQHIDGTFSVILAVNVLHATADISATIDRLKALLSPDGVLISVEVIGKQRWADITVGLLDEWWSYTDSRLRPDYPALNSSMWQPLLEKAGFASVVTLPEHTDRQSIFSRQELIVASEPLQSKRMLVVGEGEFAHKVTQHLQNSNVSTDRLTTQKLAEHLSSSSALDAVLWVSEQRASFDESPINSASSAVESSIRSLLATAQLLAAETTQPVPRLYVITAGACAIPSQSDTIRIADAPLLGLATGIAAEIPALRCTRIDCSPEQSDLDAACIAAEVLSNAAERWSSWRSETRYLARLESVGSAITEKAPPVRVQLDAGVGIDSLNYTPAAEPELLHDEVEISVRATAVNFRDVLQSLGVINLDAPLGTDCAGIVSRMGTSVADLVPGDEVVAIAPGCFASHAITSRALVVHKPMTMSFADAAAQAVAYLTADFCLNELARVRPGERVLIHAAAGGVGLAAVHLCMRLGAEPLATAGSSKKRAFLRSLGIKEVGDSRSLDFAREFSGGVDIVLNSLAGEAIDAGLQLLRAGGRFIELGKTDLRSPELVERRWPGVRYLPADLTPLFATRSSWVGKRLTALFHDISEGSLPALPTTVFPFKEIKQAFRYTSRAEHIGRVVVERSEAKRFEGSHLITGGMRGIGLRLAEWLVDNGVRELVLIGRHGPDDRARQIIERLEACGTVVKTIQGDIADLRVAIEAVRLAGDNLNGVWHGAGTLENAALVDQSWESIQKVLKPKMDGAWNLHTLTRSRQLEFFVLFSSWASIDGSHGQANHVAANAFLDALSHLRRANGLAALSVNWGAWGETGAAAGDTIRRQLARSGIEAMAPSDALESLRLALTLPDAQVAIASIRWPRYLDQRKSHGSLPFYANFLPGCDLQGTTPTFQASLTKDKETGNGLQLSSTASSVLEQIQALPVGTRSAAITRAIMDVVSDILRLPPGEPIDPDLPLGELGMDSLLAIELQNVLSELFCRQFPSTLLFDYPTVRALVTHLGKDMQAANPSPPIAALRLSSEDASTAARNTLTGNDSILGLLDTIEQMPDPEMGSFDSRS